MKRGTGNVSVYIDIDKANRVNGREEFTRVQRGTSGLTDTTYTDYWEFIAKPTVELYFRPNDSTSATLVVSQENTANPLPIPGRLESYPLRSADDIDKGSDFADDPFLRYTLGTEGEYFIVIGSEINYEEFSTIYKEASEFADSKQGVVRGQTYEAIVSITDQSTNENALTLAGKSIKISDGPRSWTVWKNLSLRPG